MDDVTLQIAALKSNRRISLSSHFAAPSGPTQECTHARKRDTGIKDRVTSDVYQVLIAKRAQDAETLAPEDAEDTRQQQPASLRHRTLFSAFITPMITAISLG